MKTAPIPKQVWECPTCNWRYESPIQIASVNCPHTHRANTRTPELIWSKTDGTPPPSNPEGGQ